MLPVTLPLGSSGAQGTAAAEPSVEERQRAWIARLHLMAYGLQELTDSPAENSISAYQQGPHSILLLLNIMAYQHGLENVCDRQCLSLELLGYLATSPEPGLPMPPRFSWENSSRQCLVTWAQIATSSLI